MSEYLDWFVQALSYFEANATSLERIREYYDIQHEV
jgi:hypothetical protein